MCSVRRLKLQPVTRMTRRALPAPPTTHETCPVEPAHRPTPPFPLSLSIHALIYRPLPLFLFPTEFSSFFAMDARLPFSFAMWWLWLVPSSPFPLLPALHPVVPRPAMAVAHTHASLVPGGGYDCRPPPLLPRRWLPCKILAGTRICLCYNQGHEIAATDHSIACGTDGVVVRGKVFAAIGCRKAAIGCPEATTGITEVATTVTRGMTIIVLREPTRFLFATIGFVFCWN